MELGTEYVMHITQQGTHLASNFLGQVIGYGTSPSQSKLWCSASREACVDQLLVSPFGEGFAQTGWSPLLEEQVMQQPQNTC